jgi:hypothetical protein
MCVLMHFEPRNQFLWKLCYRKPPDLCSFNSLPPMTPTSNFWSGNDMSAIKFSVVIGLKSAFCFGNFCV